MARSPALQNRNTATGPDHGLPAGQQTERCHHWPRRLTIFVLALVLVGMAFVVLVDHRVAVLGETQLVAYDQLAGLAAESTFDCVIVPGALVHTDGQPSEMLADRLDMAIQIYEDKLIDRIIVSGDHGRPDYNEVGVMRAYLMAAGIPEACIFMDHAGFDTYDTVYRAQAVFGVKRAILTTQEFQLLRALYIGMQLDVDLWGVACVYADSYRSQRYRLREYLARTKAFFDCEILHSLPTFTGPTIPIDGDGRLTNDA